LGIIPIWDSRTYTPNLRVFVWDDKADSEMLLRTVLKNPIIGYIPPILKDPLSQIISPDKKIRIGINYWKMPPNIVNELLRKLTKDQEMELIKQLSLHISNGYKSQRSRLNSLEYLQFQYKTMKDLVESWTKIESFLNDQKIPIPGFSHSMDSLFFNNLLVQLKKKVSFADDPIMHRDIAHFEDLLINKIHYPFDTYNELSKFGIIIRLETMVMNEKRKMEEIEKKKIPKEKEKLPVNILQRISSNITKKINPILQEEIEAKIKKLKTEKELIEAQITKKFGVDLEKLSPEQRIEYDALKSKVFHIEESSYDLTLELAHIKTMLK